MDPVHDRPLRRHRSVDDQLRRTAGRSGHLLRRPRVAGGGRPAAVQRAAHGPRGGAVDAGTWRGRDSDVHVGVGQGTHPESGTVDGVARLGVGPRQDARAGAGALEDPRQSDHSRTDRHGPRAAARRDQRKEAGPVPRRGEGESRGGHSVRPLRGPDGVRPRRRVPAVRRRVVYDRLARRSAKREGGALGARLPVAQPFRAALWMHICL